MDTLMELVKYAELVNCDYKDSDEDVIKVRRLKELGLTRAAEKHMLEIKQKSALAKLAKLKIVKITKAQIETFLDLKVFNYNNKTKTKNKRKLRWTPQTASTWVADAAGNSAGLQIPQDWITKSINILQEQEHLRITTISAVTLDYCSNEEGTIGQFCWTETPIALYPNIPPEHALQKIEKHRTDFDYFTIAEVNSIKDPLLLGRIVGIEDRFFLAQWGDDVKLDDII